MRSKAYLFSIFLFFSCSGVNYISKVDLNEIYGAPFLKQVANIKSTYGKGEKTKALSMLKNLEAASPESKHQALIKNLYGVISFQEKKYDRSINYFKQALELKTPDNSLISQVNLNISSSYFKLKKLEDSYSYFERVEKKHLEEKEKKKYYHLGYLISSGLKGDQAGLKYLVYYLSDFKNISDLKQSPLMEKLTQNYMRMSYSEKIRFLEEFEKEKTLVVPYLAFIEAERLYHSGKKEPSKDVLEWISDNYGDEKEISRLAKGLEFKMANFSKINPNAIGIVLPLGDSKKARYAKRAMLGIDMAFSQHFKKAQGQSPVLHIKDSQGSPVVGASRVKELIEKHYVSVIIGGLFSKEATREYLEAKKYGVMFISLSQIYLPRAEKTHLLFEVSGSVESIVGGLFKGEMLEKFGKKGALLYPNSERGRTFMNEFWRQARSKNVEVTAVQSFRKNLTDYRGPVRNILNLNYKRERKEELEIFDKIHSLQKKGSVRRVQSLTPVVDFDWIFVPAFPQEALQIIPSFSYYDAFKVNFLGVPSWQSGTFLNRSKRMNPVYVMGMSDRDETAKFKKMFSRKYKKRARLIETISYEAMNLVSNILSAGEFSSRDELELYLVKKEKIDGITGDWNYEDGLWIKSMTPLKLYRGKAFPLFSESESASNRLRFLKKTAI